MTKDEIKAKHALIDKFGRSLARLDKLKDSIREVKAAGMLQKADKAEATLQSAAELLTELVFLSGELINEISRIKTRVAVLEEAANFSNQERAENDTATN